MKNFLLFILGVTAPGFAFGQDYDAINSLYTKLEEATGKLKADLYLEIAWEYRKSHPDSTLYYCDLASDYATSENILSSRAQALNYKGVAYHYMGEYLLSFDYYNKAIEESLNQKDSIQYAHALNSLGRTYLNQGDFLKAYDHYFKALRVFERHEDLQGLGYCYKSLSEFYQTQSDLTKALEMSEKTLNIRMKTGNIRGQISILVEMADIRKAMNDMDRAFDFYLQAKVKAESINDEINIAVINLGIAQLSYSQGNFQESLTYAKKALVKVESGRNKNLLNGILVQLGQTSLALKQYEPAKKYCNEAIQNATKSKDLAILRDAHFVLSEIYLKERNMTSAYENYVKYSEHKLTLNNVEVARTIERLESRLEINKRDQTNELLLANQTRDKAIIESQHIQNIALIAVTSVIFILVINLYITSRKRKHANLKLQRKNQRIAQQREEITAQNEQINLQNEKLKKRNEALAEINNEKDTLMNIVAHDLKSPFNRIKGLIELFKLSVPNDEQKNYIELLDDVSSSGIDLIRDLLDVNAFEENKRKPEIKKIDLHELLLNKTKSFYSDGKVKGIEIKTPGIHTHVFLESDLTYLSRILDNLISNAIKFSSNNSEVILSAGKKQETIFISVKDHGQGFSEEDKKHLYTKFKKLSARPTAGESSNGLGLAIVKTLVDRMGGEIELISTLGRGSEFVIKFPAVVEVPVEEV